MGSKSSKSEKSNSHQQSYYSGSQYPRVYPHVVPEHHQQYPIYEHAPVANPQYVTAVANPYNVGQSFQNVAHVQAEHRPQHATYPQPTNHNHDQGKVVLPSPTAPPLSLMSHANNTPTKIIVDKRAKSTNPQDEHQATEKLKKLNRFLKEILASVPEHYTRKGYYCEGCNCGFSCLRLRGSGEMKRGHNNTEAHLQSITDAMKERYCPFCRVDLLCTDLLWRKHEESDIHKFWKEKSEKNCGAIEERKKIDFKGKKPYLVVSGFPASTRWRQLKIFFQDFDPEEGLRVEMGKNNDSEFARVFFRKRVKAVYIHESGFPLIFENRRLKSKLEWMV